MAKYCSLVYYVLCRAINRDALHCFDSTGWKNPPSIRPFINTHFTFRLYLLDNMLLVRNLLKISYNHKTIYAIHKVSRYLEFNHCIFQLNFSYMISTMFSSASLAAVTTVVMFLLTYMPYVIVIAMEAVFGLGYKLLIVC